MTEQSKASLKQNSISWVFYGGVAFFVVIICCYGYYKSTFPETRCEFGLEHLNSPDSVADCYQCHVKATPKVAQDWYESKHGVVLVKCFVCHGQPDGKGSIPYAVDPDVNGVCRKCHDPAIKKMEEKFGLALECNACHPFHQNSLHHDAYAKSGSKKKM